MYDIKNMLAAEFTLVKTCPKYFFTLGKYPLTHEIQAF